MKINNVFYKGYEGEKEIRFIKGNEENIEIISIWDGFFNDILEQITPAEKGWEGLAYYYHLCIGWYEHSPWEIPDTKNALEQLKSFRSSDFRFERSKDVLETICTFLSNAIKEGKKVYICEE